MHCGVTAPHTVRSGRVTCQVVCQAKSRQKEAQQSERLACQGPGMRPGSFHHRCVDKAE